MVEHAFPPTGVLWLGSAVRYINKSSDLTVHAHENCLINTQLSTQLSLLIHACKRRVARYLCNNIEIIETSNVQLSHIHPPKN